MPASGFDEIRTAPSKKGIEVNGKTRDGKPLLRDTRRARKCAELLKAAGGKEGAVRWRCAYFSSNSSEPRNYVLDKIERHR